MVPTEIYGKKWHLSKSFDKKRGSTKNYGKTRGTRRKVAAKPPAPDKKLSTKTAGRAKAKIQRPTEAEGRCIIHVVRIVEDHAEHIQSKFKISNRGFPMFIPICLI